MPPALVSGVERSFLLLTRREGLGFETVPPNVASLAACAVVFAVSSAALAQTPGVSSRAARKPGWSDDQAQVRLRYGVAMRNGSETGADPAAAGMSD